MKTKHTPGPWQVGSTIALRHRVIDGNANEVATMKGEFELEKQANARLIAAAPEMLEALCSIYYMANLQLVLESKYSKPTVAIIMSQLESAIAKARGES